MYKHWNEAMQLSECIKIVASATAAAANERRVGYTVISYTMNILNEMSV